MKLGGCCSDMEMSLLDICCFNFVLLNIFCQPEKLRLQFLASPDALEVIVVSYSVSVSIDLTDVTLVSDDTY